MIYWVRQRPEEQSRDQAVTVWRSAHLSFILLVLLILLQRAPPTQRDQTPARVGVPRDRVGCES